MESRRYRSGVAALILKLSSSRAPIRDLSILKSASSLFQGRARSGYALIERD